ncbi:MAG: metallophosphoesterase family protein [Bacteroidia bacterium]
MKKNKGILFNLFLCLALSLAMQAQTVSPFNGLKINDSASDYTFIVSGHFHGSSANTSTYPAGTLLANIDTLNSVPAAFLMSLGDLFVDVNETYIDHYDRSLFRKLKMPLFNAVGNHDVSNGNLYAKYYGASYYSFAKGSERFIILDTETDDGSIDGEQLNFFKAALEKATAESKKNIFIFSHRPVWAEANDRYRELFKNSTRTLIGSNNFESVVRPLLAQDASKAHIYWISGSLGGGPSSFFYDKDATGITYMQTAIRDQESDAVLIADVRNGVVSFHGLSLTGKQLDPVESYGVDYWKGTGSAPEKFNFRLLPYLIKKMLLKADFWIGALVSLIGTIVFLFLRKKWKRKK